MKNFWKGKRVMITGHAGFLGSQLARVLKGLGALNYGVDIRERIFVPYDANFQERRANFEAVFMGDVTDYLEVERLIAEWRPNFIFHLAAISQVVDAAYAPMHTYNTNIMGTANILEAVRKSKQDHIRIVIASSDKAYGRMDYRDIADESTPLNPFHPYDVSKAAADFVARSYADIYGLKVGITRCGNIYGPGDTNWQRLIPGAIRAVLTDEELVIRSDGGPKRVYNYVDDIIRAYLLIAEDLANEGNSGMSWTIAATNDYYGVWEIVEMVGEALGTKVPSFTLGGASEEERHLQLDATKILAELDWLPRTSMKKGILATAEWMKKYMEQTSL